MQPLLEMEEKRIKAVNRLAHFISLRCDTENHYRRALEEISNTVIPEFSTKFFNI